jgi:hypothetical protein
METKKQLIQNLVIKGSVIKAEPARKTGYYLIIQEQETNQQKGAFSKWSYEVGTNGLFTLRQDNKYCLITDYQVLNEPSLINNLVEVQKELSQDQSEPTKFHKVQEAQEQKHEASQVKQLEARVEQLLKENQELRNLNGNNISYFSFVFSQQVKKYQSKPNRLSQWDKEHLENCQLLLNKIEHQAQELKAQGIVSHVFK